MSDLVTSSTLRYFVRITAQSLKARNGRLMLVSVDPALRDQLARTGLLAELGTDNLFLATPQIGAAANASAAEAPRWVAES